MSDPFSRGAHKKARTIPRPDMAHLMRVYERTPYARKISPDRTGTVIELLIKRNALEWSTKWIGGHLKGHMFIWYYEGDSNTELLYDCDQEKFYNPLILGGKYE